MSSLRFEGINGYPLLLVDGSGQLHLVITWRTRTQIHGTYLCSLVGVRMVTHDTGSPRG